MFPVEPGAGGQPHLIVLLKNRNRFNHAHSHTHGFWGEGGVQDLDKGQLMLRHYCD